MPEVSLVDNVSRSWVVSSERSKTVLKDACSVVSSTPGLGSRYGCFGLGWTEAAISASSPCLEVAIRDG